MSEFDETPTAHFPPAPEPTEAEQEQERKLTDDELLADMPPLRPANRLRIRHKNRLTRLVLESELIGKDGDGFDPDAEPDTETTIRMLSLIEGVDDFAESIALDPEAYAEWAEGKGYDVFLALMNRYSEALGK